MRKRVFGVVAGALLLSGIAGAAAHASPDPNGPAKYGLCTAYFAGSQTGQDHKHQAGPFQALEQAASDNNQSVEDFCASATPGGK